MNRCCRVVPCLDDPARRSSLGLKVALVILHLIYVGVLFLFDGAMIEKTKSEPWYMGSYLLLFVVTLIQYFVTSSSSPGYVLDAMKAFHESNAVSKRTSLVSSYLILTNQTTFELVRRRRISYLRGIPERVYPFSKGFCHNLYNFCFASSGAYNMEPLPTEQEIEEKLRPYACLDILTCRCC